jgi:probable O-glycosylation ligase (exosortase A-associated)
MSYIALLLFFILDYVRPISYVPELAVLKLNTLVPLVAFLGIFWSGSAAAASTWVWSDRSTRAIGVFLTLVTLSVLVADVQEFAWIRFNGALGFAALYWVMVSELTTIARIQGVFAMLVVVHVIVAALNPVIFINPEQRNYIASGAFLGDGNDFALSLDIALPLCLFLFLNAKAWLRPVWIAALLIMVACVVLSQSRGGTLGLGAMAVYYWFKSPKKFQTGATAAVIVVLILSFAPSAYFDRIRQIGDTTEGSASSRLVAWGVGVRMALDNPLFGVGAGHFPTKFGNEYRPRDYDGPQMTAHSVYFLALGELGFPGLAVLIYFIVSNLFANQRLLVELRNRHGSKTREVQLLASLSASVIAFATAGAFLSCLYYPHIYVIAALQASARNVLRRSSLESGDAAPVAKSTAITIHPALRPPPRRPLTPAALQR